jgi:hypothetical protein
MAALTFKQSANLRLKRDKDDVSVTFFEVMEQTIVQLGVSIMDKTVTNQDSYISPSACSQVALNTIAQRFMCVSYPVGFISAMTTDSAFATTEIVNITDVQLTVAAKRHIGNYANWVGTII